MTFESTAELYYLGRPKLVLGLAHVKFNFEPGLSLHIKFCNHKGVCIENVAVISKYHQSTITVDMWIIITA